jgi:hypothetical protein
MSVIKQILINNLRREQATIGSNGCKSKEGIRKYPQREEIPDRENIRQTFSHDTDRIIHSLSYTRYIDKTQVFYLFENDHITHRVLHVQIVSKIARQIGRVLHLNGDLIEAISLAHDLARISHFEKNNSIFRWLWTQSLQPRLAFLIRQGCALLAGVDSRRQVCRKPQREFLRECRAF